MRWNGFARSVLFAAVAAAGFAPFALMLAPWLATSWIVVAYALLAIPIYLVGLSANRRRGLGAGMLAAALGAVVLGAGASPDEVIVGVALALGLARSGLVHPIRFGRAVALESVLLLGGLVVAHILSGSSALSIALAIWGFFLVQSVFFLAGGARWERRRVAVDPFDEARDRANAILEDTAV